MNNIGNQDIDVLKVLYTLSELIDKKNNKKLINYIKLFFKKCPYLKLHPVFIGIANNIENINADKISNINKWISDQLFKYNKCLQETNIKNKIKNYLPKYMYDDFDTIINFVSQKYNPPLNLYAFANELKFLKNKKRITNKQYIEIVNFLLQYNIDVKEILKKGIQMPDLSTVPHDIQIDYKKAMIETNKFSEINFDIIYNCINKLIDANIQSYVLGRLIISLFLGNNIILKNKKIKKIYEIAYLLEVSDNIDYFNEISPTNTIKDLINKLKSVCSDTKI